MPAWAGVIGGAISYIGNERSNQQNEDLSNTAYSRAMVDMRRAGLNPMLASKIGGASTPVMTNSGSAAVNSGMQSMQASSNEDKQAQEIQNLKEAVNLTTEQIAQTSAATTKLYAEYTKIVTEKYGLTLDNMRKEDYQTVLNDNIWLAKIKEYSESIGIKGSDLLNIFKLIKLKGKGTIPGG